MLIGCGIDGFLIESGSDQLLITRSDDESMLQYNIKLALPLVNIN
jgi:hypothetical protein